ncbi:MAG: hypothetical protein AB7G88_16185 [Thermomicrobiales bacterium]
MTALCASNSADDFTAMNPSPSNSFKVSALSSPVLGAHSFASLAARGPVNGVEIDLLDTLRFRLQQWSRATPDDLERVDVVWFTTPPENRAPEAALKLVKGREKLGLPTRLVIDQPRAREREMHERQISLAIKLRTTLPESVRVTIGVRPFQIESTRAHLARLTTLRMQASEWDIDLAVDLGRELDWLWEAEAALYRIIGSLALVRLSYPTTTFDGRFRSSLTQRTVLTCAELGYSGDFSLVIPLPWWHWRNARSLEAACRDTVGRMSRELGIEPATAAAELSTPRLADMA